jgi:hypothetical protein
MTQDRAILMFLVAVVAGCQQAASTQEAPPPSGMTVTVVPSSAALQVNTRQQFVAAVTGTSATAVTWTVLEGSPGGTVTNAGLYTAPATASVYHVVVTSAADPTKSATATVTVTTAPQPVTVTVSPGSPTVQAGATQQFTAVVTGSPNTSSTWSVSEGASGGTVSSTGLYSAPATAGTYHVVATSVADPTRTATAIVTVTAAPPIVTVTVSPGTVTVAPGGTQQFTATVTNNSNTVVSWSVQEGSAGGTITAAGLYTAPSVTGTYHAVATSAADNTRSGTAVVSVSAPGSTAYTSRASMPAHDGSPAMNWLSGEIAIVKDSVGGDLVSFFKGSTSLRAAVSRDLGVTWSWVDPAAVINIGKPGTIHQDRLGKVHIGYGGISGPASYARLALARDGAGHVTGFSAEVTGVTLPGGANPGMDIRFQIVPGKDQAGNDTIFFATYDDPGSGARGRIQAGKTTPGAALAPTASAHFVRLDGTTGGATTIFTGGSAAIDSSHNNGVEMAQHPASLDLWFQWGPIETGDTNTQNQNPVRRLRVTPSGPSAFAVGSTVTVESFSTFAPEVGSVVSTPNSVFMARFSPTNGYVIDRIDSSGNVTANAIPSPHPVARSGGYVVLAVNSTGDRAWAGGWISYTSVSNGSSFWAQYWNGSTWQKFTDTSLGDTWGVGRSVGWDGGLAMVALDPATFAPSFATVRTGP